MAGSESLRDPHEMLADSATAGGEEEARRRRRNRKIITKVSNVPESHFYGAMGGEPHENLNGHLAKRKVGRPFKGEVEEFTKEPHVPERRSILRGFKKFFAKKEFDDILGLRYRPTLNAAGER